MLGALGVKKMETRKPTNQREGYRTLYLKRSTWELIQLAHGWKGRGSVKAFADSIGVTRQYCSGLVTNTFGCSTNVLMAIKNLLGIRRGECWCHLFDEKKIDVSDSHPILNQGKYMGEIPYKEVANNTVGGKSRDQRLFPMLAGFSVKVL